MAILTSKLPRSHKRLSIYSKEELDEAETYLNKKKLLKAPKICWVFWAFYPIYLFMVNSTETSAGKLLHQMIEEYPYTSLFVLMIPLYAGIKIKENHLIKVTLDYFKASEKVQK